MRMGGRRGTCRPGVRAGGPLAASEGSVMTATDQQTALFATFAEPERARRFIEELKRARFTDDEIGVLGPKDEPLSLPEEGAAAGALAGVAPGALAGAVAAGLAPGVG